MSRGGLARRQAPGRPPGPSVLARLAAGRGAPLLERARRLGATVRGLRFHEDPQGADPSKYVEAVDACREVSGQRVTGGWT